MVLTISHSKTSDNLQKFLKNCTQTLRKKKTKIKQKHIPSQIPFFKSYFFKNFLALVHANQQAMIIQVKLRPVPSSLSSLIKNLL